HVIRRGDDDGIERFLLLKHLTEIFIHRCLWMLLTGFGRHVRIHVAQGDDVFTGATFNVAGAFAPGPDDADVQLIIGRDTAAAGSTTAEGGCAGSESGIINELAAG